MKQMELTCIRCPLGCQLTVTLEENAVTLVEGNQCRLGKTYAEKESINPTRLITTTIPLQGGLIPVIPVKSSIEIPKKDGFTFMNALLGITASAPVNMGDIIATNIADTGADLIATRSVGCVR